MADDKEEGMAQDPYVVTSIRIRRSVRQDAKVYAARHETTIQCVIEDALAEYLRTHE